MRVGKRVVLTVSRSVQRLGMSGKVRGKGEGYMKLWIGAVATVMIAEIQSRETEVRVRALNCLRIYCKYYMGLKSQERFNQARW